MIRGYASRHALGFLIVANNLTQRLQMFCEFDTLLCDFLEHVDYVCDDKRARNVAGTLHLHSALYLVVPPCLRYWCTAAWGSV